MTEKMFTPYRKLHNKTKANTVQTTPSPSSLSLYTYTFFSPNTLTLTISNVLNYNVLKLVSSLKKILCTSVTAREFDIVATSWYGSQSSADSFLPPMTQITVLTSAEVTVTVSVTVSVTVWLHHAKRALPGRPKFWQNRALTAGKDLRVYSTHRA